MVNHGRISCSLKGDAGAQKEALLLTLSIDLASSPVPWNREAPVTGQIATKDALCFGGTFGCIIRKEVATTGKLTGYTTCHAYLWMSEEDLSSSSLSMESSRAYFMSEGDLSELFPSPIMSDDYQLRKVLTSA